MDYLDKEIFGKIGIIGFKKHIKIKQLNHVKLFETKNRILVRVQRVPHLTPYLRKITLYKICISGTVGGPLLTRKSPTRAYISQKLW